MQYTLSNQQAQSIGRIKVYNHEEKSLLTRFLNWCEAQESDRFLWLALTFFLQIGLTLPVTAYCIVFFGGNNLILWMIIGAVNVPSLVVNLAAFPTKTTLPFLFFGWLTQAVVIMYCIGFGLMH